MIRSVAAERFILGASCTLVADEVRIGATETCRTYGLVSIDHDVMTGSFLDAVEIVVVHRLRIVVVTARDDVTDVAALHGIVTVAVHQVVSILKVALVILRAGAGLVVHHQLHALAVGVVVQRLDVEVWIGRDEIKDITFPHICPVFPTDIPALDKYLVEAVLGGEIDVAAYLLVVGGVATMRLHFLPIDAVELDAWIVIGIVPVAFADNHLPPYSAVLCRMNPADIFQCTWLVEVQDEVRGKHIACVVRDDDRPPRRLAGCLHGAFQSCSIWSQVADEGESGR